MTRIVPRRDVHCGLIWGGIQIAYPFVDIMCITVTGIVDPVVDPHAHTILAPYRSPLLVNSSWYSPYRKQYEVQPVSLFIPT
jgi:hypothetical protein